MCTHTHPTTRRINRVYYAFAPRVLHVVYASETGWARARVRQLRPFTYIIIWTLCVCSRGKEGRRNSSRTGRGARKLSANTRAYLKSLRTPSPSPTYYTANTPRECVAPVAAARRRRRRIQCVKLRAGKCAHWFYITPRPFIFIWCVRVCLMALGRQTC